MEKHQSFAIWKHQSWEDCLFIIDNVDDLSIENVTNLFGSANLTEVVDYFELPGVDKMANCLPPCPSNLQVGVFQAKQLVSAKAIQMIVERSQLARWKTWASN